METPFYHDDTADVPQLQPVAQYGRHGGHKAVSKRSVAPQGFVAPVGGAPGLKLLQGQPGAECGASPGGVGGDAGAPLLTGPDMSLLKLAAPDLEHLIIHSAHGRGAGSPAPASASGSSSFLYRNQVTNEQEGFADGFVKALADLHKQNQLVGAPMSPSLPVQSAYPRNVSLPAEMPVYTNLSSYGAAQLPAGGAYPAGPLAYSSGAAQGRCPDEPQIVPEAPHPPGDPAGPSPQALSPVDLETQEQIKAERKRLRNRIAASKCRRRKLERISRLEEKVRALKGQNAELASTAGLLRQQVAQLKQKVANHVTSGCQITVGSVAPAKSVEAPGC
ncbi:junE proto-oncogene, AP-1 transcription factor subunit [Scleropages formosus]|nr:transcription factor AP-1-like [Scleropages formosus]XP_029115518.1 transcription factor AP-1-like [Scleropages formosus]XP_029115519.1 transcription factor AP-1-like [Scleropages formosus]XP_029115520.1 transcription factor AP-1-like [Scleropages formosus]